MLNPLLIQLLQLKNGGGGKEGFVCESSWKHVEGVETYTRPL